MKRQWGCRNNNQPLLIKAIAGYHKEETNPTMRLSDQLREMDKVKVQCYKCKGYGHFANNVKCSLFIQRVIHWFSDAMIVEESEGGSQCSDARKNNDQKEQIEQDKDKDGRLEEL